MPASLRVERIKILVWNLDALAISSMFKLPRFFRGVQDLSKLAGSGFTKSGFAVLRNRP